MHWAVDILRALETVISRVWCCCGGRDIQVRSLDWAGKRDFQASRMSVASMTYKRTDCGDCERDDGDNVAFIANALTD